MQDDFDNGMGMPDEEIGGGAGEVGEMPSGVAEAEPEAHHGASEGRSSGGGARARKSSGSRKSSGARKAGGSRKTSGGKSAKRSRGAKKKGGKRPARKGAKKGGKRKAGKKK